MLSIRNTFHILLPLQYFRLYSVCNHNRYLSNWKEFLSKLSAISQNPVKIFAWSVREKPQPLLVMIAGASPEVRNRCVWVQVYGVAATPSCSVQIFDVSIRCLPYVVWIIRVSDFRKLQDLQRVTLFISRQKINIMLTIYVFVCWIINILLDLAIRIC
jgi:hypothetical protein